MECPICLTEIKSAPCETECGHKFHSKCIFEAIQRNVACPMCRLPLCDSNRIDKGIEIMFTRRDNSELQRQQRNYDARRRRYERNNPDVMSMKHNAEQAFRAFANYHAVFEDLWNVEIEKLGFHPEIAKAKRARALAMRRMRRAASAYKKRIEDTLGARPVEESSANQETLSDIIQRFVNDQ